jgi:hypothetical protein
MNYASGISMTLTRIRPSFLGLIQLFLKRHIPCCLEFSARFPFREFVAIGDLVTDFEEKLNILNRAGEFPFGIHFVGNLMIMMRRVIVFLLLTETSRFANEIFAATGIKRRYTPFGKFKMIGAIKPAFFRLTVRHHYPVITPGCCC